MPGAGGIVAAVDRRRAEQADVQLDPVGLEEDAADAFAVDPEVLAAIDEIGEREHVALALVGAAVVGQVETGGADARLPEWALLGRGGAGEADEER